MISQNKANSILNSLFAPSFIRTGDKRNDKGELLQETQRYDPRFQNMSNYAYLVPTAETYLGFCSGEPDPQTGSVGSAGEPSSDYGYARKRVGGYKVSDGTDKESKTPDADRKYFQINASKGVIKNSAEIQFSTAQKDYPGKMNYWFLSDGEKGTPFLWGKIKDIFIETTDKTGPAILNQIDLSKGDLHFKEYIIPQEELFEISDNERLIVSWDGRDYEVNAKLVTRPGINEVLDEPGTGPYLMKYIYLGNVDFDKVDESADDYKPEYGSGNIPPNEKVLPFAMSYKIQKINDENSENSMTVTQRSEGRLRVYTFDNEDKELTEGYPTHEFGLYGIGITIPAATVPTFYKDQLQASLDVSLTGN